jgi:hypothetical protein
LSTPLAHESMAFTAPHFFHISQNNLTGPGYVDLEKPEGVSRGGSLRFELMNGGKEIAEYWAPFDSKSSPFIRRLKRMPESAPVTSA